MFGGRGNALDIFYPHFEAAEFFIFHFCCLGALGNY